jgi:ABC-type uncharacterized transport system fused permease/ATPase subunit
LSCTNARLHAGFAQGEAFGGEQQRLAFARVLIHPPDILIMDEPTSSLDELSQFRLMEYMRDLLPDTMVIHAGHRPGLERFHDGDIQLVREKREGLPRCKSMSLRVF